MKAEIGSIYVKHNRGRYFGTDLLELQKKASLMDRFLKRNKDYRTIQNENSMQRETTSMPPSNNSEIASGSVIPKPWIAFWLKMLAWRCIKYESNSSLSHLCYWSLKQTLIIVLVSPFSRDLKLNRCTPSPKTKRWAYITKLCVVCTCCLKINLLHKDKETAAKHCMLYIINQSNRNNCGYLAYLCYNFCNYMRS